VAGSKHSSVVSPKQVADVPLQWQCSLSHKSVANALQWLANWFRCCCSAHREELEVDQQYAVSLGQPALMSALLPPALPAIAAGCGPEFVHATLSLCRKRITLAAEAMLKQTTLDDKGEASRHAALSES
jgi:hypothetical protein